MQAYSGEEDFAITLPRWSRRTSSCLYTISEREAKELRSDRSYYIPTVLIGAGTIDEVEQCRGNFAFIGGKK